MRKENAKLVRSKWDEDANSSSSCAGRRRNFFFFKSKTKTETKTNCCIQKRKKMKKGVVAAALCARSATKISPATKDPKIKIATRSLRNEHATKVHENCRLPERAQKAKGEIHTKFRGAKQDPQINK